MPDTSSADLMLPQQTDEAKEQRRLAALERKAAQYDAMSRGVDLDDEAANDLHEVDFIAKNLAEYIPEQTPRVADGIAPSDGALRTFNPAQRSALLCGWRRATKSHLN